MASAEIQDGIAKLLGAYQAVLGVNLDTQLRAVLEVRSWYREELPLKELFCLWICDNLSVESNPEWVFELIRPNERRHLFDSLAIPREMIANRLPRDWANTVFRACSLPAEAVQGVRSAISEWDRIRTLIANDEDERAAVLSRQRAERLLKQVLFFHCSGLNVSVFVDILSNPGSLRLPSKLLSSIGNERPVPVERVRDVLTTEDVMDLGFLVIALRKFSVRLDETSAVTPLGNQLRLFEQREADAFNALSTALQAYHHDKPSKIGSRRGDFDAAVRDIQDAMATMVQRRVMPDSLLVTESSCFTNFGRVFRGINDNRQIRCLRADAVPKLGARIMYVSATERDYSSCFWVESPWQAVA